MIKIGIKSKGIKKELQKNRRNSEKGIELITLAVTIIVMIVISTVLVYYSTSGIKIKKLRDMENDIEILSDKINIYIVKNNTLPVSIKYLGPRKFIPQANDNDVYYVINLSLINDISLNYGNDYYSINTESDTNSLEDVYIINEQSHNIYYPRGINVNGTTYFTVDEGTRDITLY